MTPQNKKTIGLILTVMIAILGVAGVMLVSGRIASQRSVSPTAPESKPQAADWVGGSQCVTKLIVGTATPDSGGTGSLIKPNSDESILPLEGEEQAPVVGSDGVPVEGAGVEIK